MLRSLVLATLLAVPAHTGYVTDLTNTLTPSEQRTLIMKLVQFEQRTTNEFAVLVVPTLDGEDIKAYTNRVFHEWGIGKKKNNGVLLLWAKQERRVRIEVGYGLEARLSDGRTGQILREQIFPRFKENQWYAGVDAGVDAVIAQLEPREAVVVSPSSVPSPEDYTWLYIILFSAVIGAVWLALTIFKSRQRTKNEPAYRFKEPPELYTPRHRTSYTPVFSSQASPSESLSSSSSWTPEPSAPSSSWSSPSDSGSSSWGSSDSGSSGSFGGGDSGGGGADGSY
jgi:uncharacterized protein